MRTKTLFASLALAVLAAAPVFADPPRALVSQSSYSLSWRIFEPHARIELTVVGPEGRLLQKTFEGGVAELDVAELAAAGSADGQYSWQLEIVPRVPVAVRTALTEARERGDADAVAQLVAGIAPGGVESGGFTVRGGALVPVGPEAPARPSRVGLERREAALAERFYPVDDDLIVIGSACIGADCEFLETFSGEALKLNSFTPRLRFEDASFAPGVPTEDWELLLNEEGTTLLDRFALRSLGNGNVPLTVRYGAPSDSLYVDASGKVGLKTATPAKELHLSASNSPTIRLEQSTTGGLPAQSWDVGGNESGFSIKDITSGSTPVQIQKGAPTDTIFVTSTGRLGIGTTIPNHKLDVRSDGRTATLAASTYSDIDHSQVLLRRFFGTQASQIPVQAGAILGDVSWRGWNGITGGNEGAHIRVIAAENFTPTSLPASMFFATTPSNTLGALDRLTIRETGRIGIGTTVPSQLLHVNGGNILVTGGGFLDDGVPVTDFVFEPDYRLMPLDELKTFVTTHKHLPNVPSKDDAHAAGGVNVGLYSMRILEKVEELTLYTLDQHEQIQALERRNAQLEQANAELQARLARIEAALTDLAQR